MHPNMALASAELENREEQPKINPRPPLPPPFLHFTPRMHTIRRTMTAVLAGYFDPTPRLAPIIQDTVPTRLARTRASVDAEKAGISNSDRKRKERGERKQKGDGKISKEEARNANKSSRHPLAGASNKPPPLTMPSMPSMPFDNSDESTPPLTPLSDDDGPRGLHNKENRRSHKYSSGKSKKNHSRKDASSIDMSRHEIEFWLDDDQSDRSSDSENGDSDLEEPPTRFKDKKRKRSESPVIQGPQRKRKNGWKGWVLVEEDDDPKESLIRLDGPVQVLETRTRSGKRAPAGHKPIKPLPRRRKVVTQTSSARDTPAISEVIQSVHSPAPSAPLDHDSLGISHSLESVNGHEEVEIKSTSSHYHENPFKTLRLPQEGDSILH